MYTVPTVLKLANGAYRAAHILDTGEPAPMVSPDDTHTYWVCHHWHRSTNAAFRCARVNHTRWRGKAQVSRKLTDIEREKERSIENAEASLYDLYRRDTKAVVALCWSLSRKVEPTERNRFFLELIKQMILRAPVL